MDINDNIKIFRKKRNMSQKELAQHIKVSQQTIQRYESKEITNIPYDKIELLASALDISPIVLMGWEEDTSDLDIVNTDTMLDKRLMAYAERLLNLKDEDRELILSMIDKLS